MAMRHSGPSIEPYAHGWLPVDNGNAVYWECCGNPNGVPAVYLHGGPGSGCTPGARRLFNPAAYKIVLFDQRGCGRSKPLVTRRADLEANTTQHLIRDIELLRLHLCVDRWAVLGVSWGTTLALAYAQAHPDRVAAMVLACVTTTSRREVEWITCGVGRLFPQQWERFVSYVPASLNGAPIVDAYASLLFADDPSVSAKAAAAWCVWEDSHVSLTPGYAPNRRFLDPEFRLRFARLVTHYWSHAAFLDDGQLINNVELLDSIPATLIHGIYDVSTPAETAWQLHQRWPKSRLHMLADAGHGNGSIPEQIVRALSEVAEASPASS